MSLDLDPIKMRCRVAMKAAGDDESSFEFRVSYDDDEIMQDIPALIAEVERLRGIIDMRDQNDMAGIGDW